MSAILQPIGELAGSSRLTRTLQSGHEHDRRRLRGELHPRRVFAEDLDQFVTQDLDDLLAGGERGHDFLADGLGTNVVDEFLDDLEVDVGLEQGEANFAKRLVNILFGQRGLAAEGLESALQFFLKILKHGFTYFSSAGGSEVSS